MISFSRNLLNFIGFIAINGPYFIVYCNKWKTQQISHSNYKGETALHQLCDKGFTSEFRVENVIEKVKILAPLADPKSIGPLHLAAIDGSIEILKILIEFLNANVYIDSYFEGEGCQFLPIDFAILSNDAEAVAILAPHTKELRLHKVFRNKGSWFVKKSMDMMKS